MAHYEKYHDILGIRPKIEPAPQLNLNSEMYENMFQQIDPNTGMSNVDSCQLQPGSISPEIIEDAVLKLFDKYKVSDIFGKIPLKSNEKPMNMTAVFQGCTSLITTGERGVDNYSDDSTPISKTFTLDEVIKIIESTEKRLNLNTVGIWENKTEELIDKHKLIEKFKEA
jgi:hypothetical protein